MALTDPDSQLHQAKQEDYDDENAPKGRVDVFADDTDDVHAQTDKLQSEWCNLQVRPRGKDHKHKENEIDQRKKDLIVVSDRQG
jgi:hypothetical protein